MQKIKAVDETNVNKKIVNKQSVDIINKQSVYKFFSCKLSVIFEN